MCPTICGDLVQIKLNKFDGKSVNKFPKWMSRIDRVYDHYELIDSELVGENYTSLFDILC